MSVGVDKMQRNFEPLKHQIDDWRRREITDDRARLTIYNAFVQRNFPTRLLPKVHHHYFQPDHEEFRPRTLWSL
mgnify:CR=1 FL=1